MLSLKSSPSATSKPCTPNLLPCHIHHDGPVDASRRYWDPRRDRDGKLSSYFRGRQLLGREVRVPAGYEGKVVKSVSDESSKRISRDQVEPERRAEGGEEQEEEEDEEEVNVLEEVASFEEMVIWDHEAVPEGDDAFVKGVEEWVRFAGAVSWALLALFLREDLADE